MIRYFVLFILFSSVYPCYSQNNYWNKESPYEIGLKKDLIFSGVALGTYFTGMHILRNEETPDFTIGSFTQSDINQINGFDRSFAGTWNPGAKDVGKVFKFTGKNLVPLGLLALPGNLKSRASLGLMFYQGFYLNGGLVTLAKGTTDRFRPFTYLNQSQIEQLGQEDREEFLEDIEGSDIEDSFYSGDAAATAYGLMFFAKVYNDYYPDSKSKYIVWTAAGLGTGLGAYFRVKSGKHFPSDVIVGALIGGGFGVLIPHLHKKKDGNKLSFYPSANGLSLSYNIR